MWKRYKQQIRVASTAVLMGALLFFYGFADERYGFIRAVGLMAAAAGIVALCYMWAAARRAARVTKELYAQWRAEDGTPVALYKRALLANGVLNDFSTPGVNVSSRVYEHGLLTVEYTYRARGGEKVERIVLAVPAEHDAAVRRYIGEL